MKGSDCDVSTVALRVFLFRIFPFILLTSNSIIISTDEDPSLRIEGFAIINLRGVSTKLYFNSIISRAILK